MTASRLYVLAGALFAAGGVALSAAAAHVASGATVETAARFLLLHGIALIAITAARAAGLLAPVTGRLGSAMIVLGSLLFCGDLALRGLAGIAPLPIAAPVGGSLLIAGWLVTAVAALFRKT